MIRGTKHLATVKPLMKDAIATGTTAYDVLMDWHPFQIPRGGCRLKSLHAQISGTQGVATGPTNLLDMTILFGRSINGVAPPSLGASNAALTHINNVAARPHIMGQKYLDTSKLNETGNHALFLGYHMIDINAVDADYDEIAMFLEGEPSKYSFQSTPAEYVGSIEDTITGYQTIWLAVVSTDGGFDFGTGCMLDMAADSTPGSSNDDPTVVTTTPVDIGLSGTDARLVFAVGDFIGSAAGVVIGKVTEVKGSSRVVVDYVREVVAHDQEIVNMTPITFNFGVEY